MLPEDKYNSPAQLPPDPQDENSPVVIHIDPEDIFHGSPSVIKTRLFLGVLYFLVGLAIIILSIYSPRQAGSNYHIFYFAFGVFFVILSIGFLIAAWHKRTYRSFINEQGLGCGNRHNIPVHAWSDVDFIVQRLYYWGTPPSNGVWGVAPRRLDEDYLVTLKSGEQLFFGRRSLGHLHKFKPLILYYSEQNGIEWKTKEIYHSRRIKAGAKLIPTLLILVACLFPLLFLGSQIGIIYGISNHLFDITQKAEEERMATRFSWSVEFIKREAERVNMVDNPGSIAPLNLRISSLFLTENAKDVAIGTDSGSFQLRDVASNIEQCSIPNALLSAVVFTMVSDNRSKALTRDFDNQLHVWDLDKKTEIFSLDVPNKFYHSSVFSPDGKFLYFGDLEGRLNVYDLKTEELVNKYSGLQNPIVFVQCSQDGRKVMAAFENNSVYIWDIFMGTDAIILNIDSPLLWAQFTDEGRTLATLEKNGTFKIWNYSIRQEMSRRSMFIGEKEKYEVFSFSPDGKNVAFGTNQGSICLTSVIKGRDIETFKVPGMKSPTPILDLKFSEENDYLFVGTKYGVWKIRIDN